MRPLLEGRTVARFRDMAEEFCRLEMAGRPLHTALQSGITQALLDARAKARRLLRAEVICEEYGAAGLRRTGPICSGNRVTTATRMWTR